jgi:hypothetical protein
MRGRDEAMSKAKAVKGLAESREKGCRGSLGGMPRPFCFKFIMPKIVMQGIKEGRQMEGK